MDLLPGRVIVQAAQRGGFAAIAVGDMEIAKRNRGEPQEVSNRLITEIEGGKIVTRRSALRGQESPSIITCVGKGTDNWG